MQLFSTRAFGLALIASALWSARTVTAEVFIPTVPIGNLGNAADPLTDNLYGSVSYAYRIGTTEVTNAQYADFLNAVATSDPLGLYDESMSLRSHGGITRSGDSGSYSYTPKTDMGDKPVNFVSWYDAIRFANWLNNGQGTGSTETGAYTISDSTATPSNGLSITRNPGAIWFLPSENEWHKAAYYQPAALGGDSDSYWLYPTASNNAPTVAIANTVGDISNPGANVANYDFGATWHNHLGDVTTVGSAGPLSDSYYGTADQGGNLLEWNEALVGEYARGLRGSSYELDAEYMKSSFRIFDAPEYELPFIGFRVAATLKLGDSNQDNLVDGADYTAWADHFLQTGQRWQAGDFTGDGIVDGADYTVWADHFAPGTLSLSAVPEPSTLALAAIGGLASLAYAMRRSR